MGLLVGAYMARRGIYLRNAGTRHHEDPVTPPEEA
jgi:hypothetical protein